MRLDADRREFAAAIADFAARECGTKAQLDELTLDDTRAHSPEILAKLSELGWLGVSLPEEYGGGGAGFVDECVFIEEAHRGLLPGLLAYTTGLTAAQTYLKWGNEEQKKLICSNLAAGRTEAIALSEPGTGSDLGAVRTKAVRDGDAYVLDGQKTWISVAHIAEHMLVLAREDSSGPKHSGLTLLMVPTDTPGIEMREVRTMEARTCNDVFFTGARVPVANVVGTAGQGWKQLMRGLSVERMIIAAFSVGAAQRSLDDAVAYMKQRDAFGQPISDFQALRHRVADLATDIATTRSFVYDVAQAIDDGHEDGLAAESAMAKMRATEVAKNAALEGMQLMGGAGYAREYGMEFQVRRALAPPIFGGTNEIQREIIAKSLF
ncbi:alkylation response protein AidB-like acyl-CoA dehydrogenase [Nocardioides sp. BE266]|uniref:acyl-CoA dehydrogenase family protein n=1 Tax=Nocardioides sp. BE266 TaxID=2817725 RepID=UPI0028569103|nr:acyl-CoA dehydrogenase family protein [Nocardioides sp. BE266]MDR7254268.1 alkylation response protein AidB-like acyl-CoA dehydrogenase [Nocardioides sp. BE266]